MFLVVSGEPAAARDSPPAVVVAEPPSWLLPPQAVPTAAATIHKPIHVLPPVM
jgi:hypothetical protein